MILRCLASLAVAPFSHGEQIAVQIVLAREACAGWHCCGALSCTCICSFPFKSGFGFCLVIICYSILWQYHSITLKLFMLSSSKERAIKSSWQIFLHCLRQRAYFKEIPQHPHHQLAPKWGRCEWREWLKSPIWTSLMTTAVARRREPPKNLTPPHVGCKP